MADIKTGLYALFLFILLPLLIALYFVVSFIYRNTLGKRMQTTIREDSERKARKLEKTGMFRAAASVYEKELKDPKKAAELYEKGGAYRQAALLYEFLGVAEKAKELYEKDGCIGDAAEVSILEGDFEGAAKLYEKAGEKINAAVTMEKAGRRMAAVRMYREAGEYRKASHLLEGEGMLKESAEMFGLSLPDREPTASSLEDFYTYAFKLEQAGQRQKAVEILVMIDKVNPFYRDVSEKLHALTPQPEDGSDSKKPTLRVLIRTGKREPRHVLKLWVRILKSLQNAYAQGRAHGTLSPDAIEVDEQDSVSFLTRWASTVYAAPETRQGFPPDERSDVYSAGVILYEMLTGSLEGLGSARVADTLEDIPDWLDDMVLRCIRKVKEDRYQSIELIINDIRALSQEKKITGRT